MKSIKKFEKNQNIKGYVVDLRNNPGGLLTQAINITDIFLDNGEYNIDHSTPVILLKNGEYISMISHRDDIKKSIKILKKYL